MNKGGFLFIHGSSWFRGYLVFWKAMNLRFHHIQRCYVYEGYNTLLDYSIAFFMGSPDLY